MRTPGRVRAQPLINVRGDIFVYLTVNLACTSQKSQFICYTHRRRWEMYPLDPSDAVRPSNAISLRRELCYCSDVTVSRFVKVVKTCVVCCEMELKSKSYTVKRIRYYSSTVTLKTGTVCLKSLTTTFHRRHIKCETFVTRVQSFSVGPV